MELAVTAVLMSIVFGIPLGLYAGLYPDPAQSHAAIMAGTILGFSLPTFWVGLMLIMVFAVQLRLAAAAGRGATVDLLGVQRLFLTLDGLRHLLPAGVHSRRSFNISLILRLTRAAAREILPMDYIKFARAKGLSPAASVIFVHVLKNIMIPIVTVIGLELAVHSRLRRGDRDRLLRPGMGKLSIYLIPCSIGR